MCEGERGWLQWEEDDDGEGVWLGFTERRKRGEGAAQREEGKRDGEE